MCDYIYLSQWLGYWPGLCNYSVLIRHVLPLRSLAQREVARGLPCASPHFAHPSRPAHEKLGGGIEVEVVCITWILPTCSLAPHGAKGVAQRPRTNASWCVAVPPACCRVGGWVVTYPYWEDPAFIHLGFVEPRNGRDLALLAKPLRIPPQPFDTHSLFSLVLIPVITLLRERRRSSRKGVNQNDRGWPPV